MCDFNISTLNLNGARTDFKRAALFKLMDIKHIDIILVEESHSCHDNEHYGGNFLIGRPF